MTINDTLAFIIYGHTPVKSYQNFYENRLQMRKDHKGKVSGIYLLYKKDDPSKCYVGQSSNIQGRINNYLNNSFLNSKKNKNAPFIKALLKYGQDSFGLCILEYTPKENLLEREKFWIDELKPYYNVLKEGTPGSEGFKHTEATKLMLRNIALNKKLSSDTKAKISQSLTGENNPFYQQEHSKQSKLMIAQGMSHGEVYVYNNQWEFLMVVVSATTLANMINSTHETVKNLIDSGDLFRGGWYFTDKPLDNQDISTLIAYDEDNIEMQAIVDDMKKSFNVRKPVFVFITQTKEFHRSFTGVMSCAKAMKKSHNTISKAIKTNEPVGEYIFSSHRVLKTLK